MDKITLAMLDALKKSGGAGHTEPGKVITWDGDITGKEQLVLEEDSAFYKISDEVIDVHNVAAVTVYLQHETNNGVRVYNKRCTSDEIVITDEESLVKTISVVVPEYLDNFFHAVVVITEDVSEGDFVVSKGLYAVCGNNSVINMYVSRVEFPETIHPIDPKFLPGVCLPKIEVSYTGNFPIEVQLSEEQVAIVNRAGLDGTPIIVHIKQQSNGEEQRLSYIANTLYFPEYDVTMANCHSFDGELTIEGSNLLATFG